MGFETPQLKLAELLAQVRDGRVQLPDFQRGYKWDDDRIRELLVTVLRGHPMGALMQLAHSDGAGVRFKPQPLARVADDAALEHRQLEQSEYLLLDGQQRMTSLYQALTGSGVVATKDSRGKLLTRRYYPDVEKALGDPSEQNDAVLSLPEDGVVRDNFARDVVLDVSTAELQAATGIMPFTALFDGTDTSWLLRYVGAPDADQSARLMVFEAFNNRVGGTIKGYVIPAIRLDKHTTKEAVATVFEKVNSGGLPLNNFELLTAIYAGDAGYYAEHGDDFRLGEDWAAHREVLHRHAVLQGMRETEFIQAVLLLATLERRRADLESGSTKVRAVTARGDDMLNLTLREYLRWAPVAREGFEWAAGFLLREHVHTSGWLPYRSQTVPLAVFRALLGTDIDVYPVLERIRRWYWAGVMGELYGSSTETRFARDVEQVPAWARAAVTGERAARPGTVEDAIFRESRLLSLRSSRSAAFKGIYALLLKHGARDWKLDQAIDHASYLAQGIDIHHIFPKSWCDKQGIGYDNRESIINKTPLAAGTNRHEVRGDSPAVYLPRLERNTGMSPEQVDALLTGHLITPETMRAADFEAFFEARRDALLDVVGAVLDTEVVRDVVRDEVGALHGEEDASAYEEEGPATREGDVPDPDVEDPDVDDAELDAEGEH